jgi:hypothetical protein
MTVADGNQALHPASMTDKEPACVRSMNVTVVRIITYMASNRAIGLA